MAEQEYDEVLRRFKEMDLSPEQVAGMANEQVELEKKSLDNKARINELDQQYKSREMQMQQMREDVRRTSFDKQSDILIYVLYICRSKKTCMNTTARRLKPALSPALRRMRMAKIIVLSLIQKEGRLKKCHQ